eukprot:scaffold27824_cov17-Tisochrysis_lutea.AAC.3
MQGKHHQKVIIVKGIPTMLQTSNTACASEDRRQENLSTCPCGQRTHLSRHQLMPRAHRNLTCAATTMHYLPWACRDLTSFASIMQYHCAPFATICHYGLKN